MPQLDIDLFDDFLFFAFVSLLFGVADDESEEAVVEMHGEIILVQRFLSQKKNNMKNKLVLLKDSLLLQS